MTPELDKQLVERFPLLYADRHMSPQETCMYWGLAVGDGWFQLLEQASAKIEPILERIVATTNTCFCEHDREFHPNGRTCSVTTLDPENPGDTSNATTPCGCTDFSPIHPKAAQVKEKFGTLRFYMTAHNPGITEAIRAAEAASAITCEDCGDPGTPRQNGWLRTLCDTCNDTRVKERANR